ncbi:ATPase [Ruegeria marisrubri]|uniref:ATPase n=1 Tax=Ruegeria marisrubri TaxID=1685379 RepID=A0A0X3UBR9_9RHOB|nr:ABC transporter ATP-binding protein [Ruegeria marisrubri]KUJ85309.1 ATPase [Ruegeria marisrubri]
MGGTALSLRGISKLFGTFRALDQVDMQIENGTVHAILGENGAGKTTLMNILFGLYQPEEGQISLRGTATTIPSPRHAMDMGIGMIHQHFMLVDSLTVAENVALGLPGQGMTLDLDRIADRLAQLSAEYDFDIDPHQEVWKLPIGMRQRVEILKVLFRDADIIILDEPTSVLAPNEIASFLDGLRRLRALGKTVIFITHKLDEVEAVADNVTILQHGRVSAEVRVAESNAKDMARLMVGREVVHDKMDRGDSKPGEVIFRADGLRARDQRGIEALKGVSIEIRAGEVLGIAGVDGNGQAELANVVAGLMAPEAGTVTIDGVDVTTSSAHARRHRNRLSYVPEDRHHTGLVLDFTIAQNAMMRDFNVPPFSKWGIINTSQVRKTARDWVDRYDVRMRSIDQKVRFLSGGNQQKLIFAREVECDPRVFVVMQPCKGLDVGAIEAVQRTVMRERAEGKAILYISTELEHIMTVADRIAVMCAGEITGTLTPDEVTDERIGALMGGLSEKEAV